MGNANLGKAKSAKKDEFYTQMFDINNELIHYKDYFRGKTVLCNCDDPRVSNFTRFFVHHFELWGLKRLISVCYKNQDIDLFSKNDAEQAVYMLYDGDKNGNKQMDDNEIEVIPLKGDGDFRSPESVELLKQADVVVTNPPFSLFREYIAQLIKYEKDFLIIGHQNAITYKEVFPLIKNNKLWLGYGFKGGAAHFISNYEDTATAGNHIEGMIRVSGVHWFTNIPTKKRFEPMDLYREYNPNDYPKFSNFDAIFIDKTENIPNNYFGMMGVPITFLDKYCPTQFEIIGTDSKEMAIELGVKPIGNEWLTNYKAHGGTGHITANMRNLVYYNKEGVAKAPYARIIIKRKQQ